MLGPLILLTDRHLAVRPLIETLRTAIEAGARTVLLRDKDLPFEERLALGRAIAQMLAPVDGALLVASDVKLALALGAHGVHLAAGAPWPEEQGLLVGISCHSTSEVATAAERGADYVMLSPIFETPSKPGYGPPLGIDVLRGHALPVYALGGVLPGRARACIDAGAAGVAVMGVAMAEPASVRVVLAEMAARTVLLVPGGFGEMTAQRFWNGLPGALAARGVRVLLAERRGADWVSEGLLLAQCLRNEPNGIMVVAGSNGISAALRLVLDHKGRVGSLFLCWPATAKDALVRGVRDEEFAQMTLPVRVLPAEPEDPFHLQATALALAARLGVPLSAGSRPAPLQGFDVQSLADRIDEALDRP